MQFLYCEFVYFFFDIDEMYNYLWRFKHNLAMNQVQLLAGDLLIGHMTSSCMMLPQLPKTYAQ